MISLLSFLLPILLIASAGGPINSNPASWTRVAKMGDSDKKPYPGCIACDHSVLCNFDLIDITHLGSGHSGHFEDLVHVQLSDQPCPYLAADDIER